MPKFFPLYWLYIRRCVLLVIHIYANNSRNNARLASLWHSCANLQITMDINCWRGIIAGLGNAERMPGIHRAVYVDDAAGWYVQRSVVIVGPFSSRVHKLLIEPEKRNDLFGSRKGFTDRQVYKKISWWIFNFQNTCSMKFLFTNQVVDQTVHLCMSKVCK